MSDEPVAKAGLASDAHPSLRSYFNQCVCGERQVRIAFVVMATIVGCVVWALVEWWHTVRHVKLWVADKRRLKEAVKRLAQRASKIAAAATAEATPVTESDAMLRWLDTVENATPPLGGESRRTKRRKGWFMVLDSHGNMWANGRSPYLARDDNGHRHFGTTNMRMVDTPLANQDVPTHRMLVEAIHNGGGFVDFMWRKNKMCVAYCRRAAGPHGLVVIGVLVVPADHTHFTSARQAHPLQPPPSPSPSPSPQHQQPSPSWSTTTGPS
jgi:hypothetical protein